MKTTLKTKWNFRNFTPSSHQTHYFPGLSVANQHFTALSTTAPLKKK